MNDKCICYLGSPCEYQNRDVVIDTNVGCKWIPCSERLPKQGEQVICTLVSARGHRFVTQEQFFPNLLKEPFPMVAWMPLPPAWKGEDNESN